MYCYMSSYRTNCIVITCINHCTNFVCPKFVRHPVTWYVIVYLHVIMYLHLISSWYIHVIMYLHVISPWYIHVIMYLHVISSWHSNYVYLHVISSYHLHTCNYICTYLLLFLSRCMHICISVFLYFCISALYSYFHTL